MSNRIQTFSSFFVRSSEAGHLLEVFFVSAVSSILVIRFYLEITNYPQLGGAGFHIAHMLWGGFFMMGALVLVLTFLNKEAKSLAAILGGIGFGTFIDELGKFVTADNNYFYQPTIGLIYVIFVLLFLGFRVLERQGRLNQKEYIVNALEMTKDVLNHDLDRAERKKALTFLNRSDENNPLAKVLRTMLEEMDNLPEYSPSLYERTKDFFQDFYENLVGRRWFTRLVIVFFVVSSAISFFRSLWILFTSPNLSFSEWGQVIFSIVSGTLVLGGIYYWRRSRLNAYHMFKRSLLVTVLLTQFFLFLNDQLSALVGLSISLLALITVQYLIEQERILSKNPRG